MSFWTAAVIIVAIVALSMMRIARYNSRRDRHHPPVDDAEKAQLRREVEDLRERVRVLERITTDANTGAALSSRKISDEIEALRDR